jgi:recombination protein RecA
MASKKSAASTKTLGSLSDNPKQRLLDSTLAEIKKQFGDGSIMRLGDTDTAKQIEAISTGSVGLDIALGIGGLPKGRIIEIYGPESSGKTTLALHAAAESQRAGGTVAFIDAEHALDIKYAAALGVKTDELIVSQPDSGEQALEITDMLVRSNAIDLLVIDSVAALVPKAELEGDMGDSHVGLQARLMSQALRKLTANTAKSHTAIIFINQLRMKIGVMFGSPETTTGGNALKYYASVRLDVRRIGAIKEGAAKENTHTGSRTRVKVVKNKVAPPFAEVEFDVMFGEGISREGEIIDLAVGLEIVQKSGAWFSYNGERLGQGREASKQTLKDRPDLSYELANKIRAHHALPLLGPLGTPLEAAEEANLD